MLQENRAGGGKGLQAQLEPGWCRAEIPGQDVQGRQNPKGKAPSWQARTRRCICWLCW